MKRASSSTPAGLNVKKITAYLKGQAKNRNAVRITCQGGSVYIFTGYAAVSYTHLDMPFLPFFAKPDDLIREVAATVHADRPQGQFRAVFLFPCTGKELVQAVSYTHLCPKQRADKSRSSGKAPSIPLGWMR